MGLLLWGGRGRGREGKGALVGMEGALVDRRGKGYCSKACWVGVFNLNNRMQMEEGSCSINIEGYIWDNNSCLLMRLESLIFYHVVIGMAP